MTKIGVGLTALGLLVQGLLDTVQGEEVANLLSVLEGTVAQVSTLIGAAVAAWGAIRAQFNYFGAR